MSLINLAGLTFGEWTVLRRDFGRNIGGAHWICCCSCGTVKSLSSQSLRKGQTRSCGCKTKQFIGDSNRTHGLKSHPLYGVWSNMRRRCNSPNHHHYAFYGARGISVCKEWESSFESFYSWAMTAGYEKGLSIDRIDNDGNYEPGNCRWAGDIVQANNKTTNHVILTPDGNMTLAEISRKTGMSYDLLKWRFNAGWDFVRATTLKPVVGRNQYE